MSKKTMDMREYGERIHASGRRLYRIAYCYVKNEQDALDIVGDATYKALKSLDNLREPDAFDSWMTRLVVSTSIDFLRRRGRCVTAPQELLEAAPDEGGLSGLEERMDLYSALDLLPAEDKAYVILKYFEGKTFAQIAGELDVPEATAKTRVYRALKRLRRHYGLEENNG